MKLVMLTLLWATLLAFPCVWVSDVWQHAVALLATLVLALFRQLVTIDRLQFMAPSDIGLFVALCLATSRATWRERRRAILIGIPTLILAEVAVVVLSIVPTLVSGGAPNPDSGVSRLGAFIMESVPWVSALLAWVGLLGGRYLWPAAGAMAGPADGAKNATGSARRAARH